MIIAITNPAGDPKNNKDNMDIKGKVVIITGASSGIGAAAARAFGNAGAKLVLAARRIEPLQLLANEINAIGNGAEAFMLQTDISKLEEIRALVSQTVARYGRIDVLVNKAGFGRLKWLEDLDPLEDIQAQIDVNVLGVIQTTRQVLPIMIEQRSGSIINICSIAGLVGTPTYTIYAATKHAVHGFSEALRREVKPWGIDVSLLYPGGVRGTEFPDHAGIQRKTNASTPKFMVLTADQVGKAIVSLVHHPRRMWVLPWTWRFTVFLNRFLPGLVDRTTIKNFTIPERADELSKK